ncbi:FAD-dependent oxidoreductase [Streptomyces sp. NPDC002285]
MPRCTERPFVGGRCISGSPGARSSRLVMPVATATGRAAGVSAAPSVRHGRSPCEHPCRRHRRLPLPRCTERPFVGGRGSPGARSSRLVMPVATATGRAAGVSAAPSVRHGRSPCEHPCRRHRRLPLPRCTERPFVGGRGSPGARSSRLVMPVATATGRAAGVSAAPSVRHGRSPREHPCRRRPDDDAPARCPPERAA